MLIREHVLLGVKDEFLKNIYSKERQRPMSKEPLSLGNIRSHRDPSCPWDLPISVTAK